MKITTRPIKEGIYFIQDDSYYQIMDQFYKNKKLIEEFELDQTIDFKLYDVAYEYNNSDIFYNFCDNYYWEFKDEIQCEGLQDVELEQLGRTSSNYITTKKGLNLPIKDYQEIMTIDELDYELNWGGGYEDILYLLQEDYAELKEMARCKEIYNNFIDNQVEAFKEYIEFGKEEEEEEIENIKIDIDYITNLLYDKLEDRFIYLSDEEIKENVKRLVEEMEVK